MDKLNEAILVKDIICMMQEKAKKDYGNGPKRRSAHTKALALLKGELVVEKGLPKLLRQGIFEQPNTYPVWMRISSSSSKPKKDSKKDVKGFAIQLAYQGQLQDFILAGTKHMPLRGVRGFHGAVSLANGKNIVKSIEEILTDLNFVELFKLGITRKHETSPLDIPYFSITPYAFGPYGVKYSLLPTSKYKSRMPQKLSPTYLRDNMKKHLTSHEATFDLMIQFKKKGLLIEDASQEWDEAVSPMIKVATLRIQPQVFDTVVRRTYGETLTFSPAHALPAHRALGSLNDARAGIYEEMQIFRKSNKNS